jgi:hypothetical protein
MARTEGLRMSGRTILWAYKPSGEACVFEMAPGDTLPPGWSHDIGVIVDPAHRDGARLSEVAKESLREPARIDGKKRPLETPPATVDTLEEVPLLYDENNQQVATIRQKPPKG